MGALLALTAALAVAACGSDDERSGTAASTGGASKAAGETTKVTLALSYSPNWFQAYFFQALDKGYYEEAGLDVDFVVPDSTQTASKLVGIGKAQFGEFLGSDPITAVAEDLPLKVVSSFAPSGDFGLLTKPDGPTEAAALDGKKVGVFSSMLYHEVCFPRFLEAGGVSTDGVEAVDVGFAPIPPVLTGKVAAGEGIKNIEGAIYAGEAGEEPGFLSYSEVCPMMPQGFIANTEWAESNPEAASAFVAASLRGVKDYVEDPAAVRETFIARYADIEDPLEYYETLAPIFCSPLTPEKGLGYNDPEQWEALLDVAVEGKAIDEPMSFDELVTDDYMPKQPVMAPACA